MELSTDLDAEIRQFMQELQELDDSAWRARVHHYPGSAGICLCIEQRRNEHREPAPHAIEICRGTFARAAASARKYIVR
jgi:hypothetical protein